MVDEGRYLSAKTVADVWICYPWEATYVTFRFIPLRLQSSIPGSLIGGCFSRDIDEHDQLAASQADY